MINIKLTGQANLSGTTMIEGFPGAGLVGPMAISYIVEKLGMKYIGYVESDEFPPLVAIHADVPMPPVRVYYSEKAKLVTILAEFAIPLSVTYELSSKLYDFIKANKIERIISIGGIPSQQADQSVVFGIASTDAAKKEAQKAGLVSVGEGVATGVSALILVNAVQDQFSDVSVLVPVDQNIVDPKYAELAILSLNKLTNLNIDIKELDKEAKEVEAKIRELLKRNKDMSDAHKKVVDDAGPSMYA